MYYENNWEVLQIILPFCSDVKTLFPIFFRNEWVNSKAFYSLDFSTALRHPFHHYIKRHPGIHLHLRQKLTHLVLKSVYFPIFRTTTFRLLPWILVLQGHQEDKTPIFFRKKKLSREGLIVYLPSYLDDNLYAVVNYFISDSATQRIGFRYQTATDRKPCALW